MDCGKLGEEYYKYLIQTHQKAAENMSTLLRTLFIALIAFGFAPALQQTTPTLLIENKVWFGAAVVVGIVGLCVEFMQYLFGSLGAQSQFIQIADYVSKQHENKRPVDPVKFFEFQTEHSANNNALFYIRIVLGCIGLICIGYPLLKWLANIK